MKLSPESNSDFQSVSSIGAGYLATTWLFTKLIFMQANANLFVAWTIFGILIQLAFTYVFKAQSNNRSAELNIPKRKGLFRKIMVT